jgi:hypothetical protein
MQHELLPTGSRRREPSGAGVKKQSKSQQPRRSAPPAPPTHVYSAQAHELRALLRRVPDGFQATLHALERREAPERERLLTELVRGMGRDLLPLVRAAALGPQDDLAISALRVLPVFGTRAAGDVVAEVFTGASSASRASVARDAARALQARGIRVAIPDEERSQDEPGYAVREVCITAPDGVGSRSVAARLQDRYGVWHAIFILWNDRAGVKDGFMRECSLNWWRQRVEKPEDEDHDPFVTCPLDYARWQIEQARTLNLQTGFPIRQYLEAWDRWIGPPPADYQPPDPLAAVREATEEDRAKWEDLAPKLFQTSEAGRWFPEAADCVPWARQWSQLQTRFRRSREREEPDSVTDALVNELGALVDEAANALVSGELPALYRRRLIDLSLAFEWQRRPELARATAATALAMELRAPGRIPFFVAFVQRALEVTWQMLLMGEDLERLRYDPLRNVQD